ncbi:hypothetical protein SAY86_019751 [Trapa natans]|uniref:DUF7755 domain-containing protein n=1 Tax=Trapa natans TaxID=22666 RepID=A0AAN7R3J2_TRANT|nr:hypothetical protein SAY86_019751 [Trapa natans]
MEILCPRSVIITARFHHRGLRLRRNLRTCTFAARSFRCLNRRSQFRIVGSKRSVYQDFQGYAAPVRLFPTTEAKVPNGIPPGEMPKLYGKGDSQAMFKIMIRTSRMYGSSLSNDNSGVMLCIIDENGNSILQRIPAVSMDCSFSGESCVSSTVHFQQGSDDEFTFQGPKLGRIQAVWISIESDRSVEIRRPGTLSYISTIS